MIAKHFIILFLPGLPGAGLTMHSSCIRQLVE